MPTKTFWDELLKAEMPKEYCEYCRKDVEMTKKAYSYNKRNEPLGVDVIINGKTYDVPYVTFDNQIGRKPRVIIPELKIDPPTITNVIFSNPATIVFWSDNTKTVVKADCEPYDPEKGIAMAVCKKMLGNNTRDYYRIFLHWMKKWKKTRTLDDMYGEAEWNGDFYNG